MRARRSGPAPATAPGSASRARAGFVAPAFAQRHARDLDGQPRADRRGCRSLRQARLRFARRIERDDCAAPAFPGFDQFRGDDGAGPRPLALAFDPRFDDLAVLDQRGARFADAGFVEPLSQAERPRCSAGRAFRTAAGRPRSNGCPTGSGRSSPPGPGSRSRPPCPCPRRSRHTSRPRRR